jgi:hypothetical protein
MGRAWFAGLALCVGACGTSETEIKDNVTVFDDALAATLVVEADRIRLPLPGNEWVAQLEPKRILASGYRAGFLRRLDSTELQGETIVLHTTQAGLPDAIKRGRLQGTTDLSRTMASTGAMSQALITGDLTTGMTFDDVVLWDDAEKGRLLLEHGFLRMSPTVTIDVLYENETLQYADILLAGDAELQATLVVESDKKLTASVDKMLYDGPSHYQLFFVGIVPVVVEYKLSLNVFGEIALECGIVAEASASLSGRIEAGARYDGNGATTRGTHSLSGSATWPTLRRPAPISAKVSLRPRLDAKLYTIAGPFLTTGIYIKGVLAQPYQRTVYGGTEANFGGQLKIMHPLKDDEALIDKTIETDYVTQEWLLFNDTLSGEPLSCDPDGGVRDGGSADLSGADMTAADMAGADMAGTDMSGADMSGSDLAGVDLAGADLDPPDLLGRCSMAMTPPEPNKVHITWDDESAPGPIPDCGKALSLTNAYDSRTYEIPRNMTQGPFTLALWVNYTHCDGYTLFGLTWDPAGPSALNGWALDIPGSSGVVHFVVHAGGGCNPFGVSAPRPAPGGWHHVAVTSNGSTTRIYVDGVLGGQGASCGATSPLPLTLGHAFGLTQGSPGCADFFQGYMDDLRIYDRELSAAEVLAVSCSCHSATDGGTGDFSVPPDLAGDMTPPPADMTMPDLTMPEDMSSLSCVQDAGAFTPPNICTPGSDATSGAGYVVCRANCDSAWISSNAAGGTYHPLAICQALGYQRLGQIGTTGGAECGAFETGTSCNNIGQRTFNGMGSLGGGAYGNNVHWECLPN